MIFGRCTLLYWSRFEIALSVSRRRRRWEGHVTDMWVRQIQTYLKYLSMYDRSTSLNRDHRGRQPDSKGKQPGMAGATEWVTSDRITVGHCCFQIKKIEHDSPTYEHIHDIGIQYITKPERHRTTKRRTPFFFFWSHDPSLQINHVIRTRVNHGYCCRRRRKDKRRSFPSSLKTCCLFNLTSYIISNRLLLCLFKTNIKSYTESTEPTVQLTHHQTHAPISPLQQQ